MQPILDGEMDAAKVYCEAVKGFTAAGFPGLACWAARQAQEEIEHAIEASEVMGSIGARKPNNPLDLVTKSMMDILSAETALLDVCTKASETYEAHEEKLYAEKVLMDQVVAVAEAVAMEVRAKRNPVALDLALGDES